MPGLQMNGGREKRRLTLVFLFLVRGGGGRLARNIVFAIRIQSGKISAEWKRGNDGC